MLGTPRLLSGALCLGGAAALSAALAVASLASGGLPGCGPQSACAELASGPWSRLPYVDWPVSFLGAAWFAGLLAAWCFSRRGLSPELRGAVRLGAFGSALFVAAMAMERKLCGYCLGIHAFNLVFCAVAWRAPESTVGRVRAALGGAAVLVGVTLLLGVARARVTSDRDLRHEEALRRTIAEVLDRERERAGQEPVDAGPTADRRHRRGSRGGRVRLRVFMDYECSGCHYVLEEIEALRQEGGDIQMWVQHYPICMMCNPYVGRSMLHPNACWAALAAEAASILLGEAGFWQMHDWLFERQGTFEDEELHTWLAELEVPPEAFEVLMRSHEAVRRVRADAAEAAALGVERIPVVFLNGVEVENVLVEGQLRRAIEAVLEDA